MSAGNPVPSDGPLLRVEDLSVSFFTRRGIVEAVKGVSLEVPPSEIVGLVGGTGSGKSATAWAILSLVPAPGRIVGGRILYQGDDLLSKSEDELRMIRGSQIAMIVQNPVAALTPFLTILQQSTNIYRAHHKANPEEATRHMLSMFDSMGLSDLERISSAYPHELSGGMAQRVLIATALASSPKLLIADEPTSNLDVTIQAQIMNLLKDLVDRTGLTVLLISHDLGLVAQYCDRVAVMYDGEVVENKNTETLFRHPSHWYTKKLIASLHGRAGE